MESNSAGVLQDPILQGFSQLKIELRSGDTKTKLLMDMGRIISNCSLVISLGYDLRIISSFGSS